MSEPSFDMIRRDRSCLVVVDLQSRLSPVIAHIEDIIERHVALLEAARLYSIPVGFTEQYPSGLGHTDQRLRDLAPDAGVFEKTTFDASAGCALVEWVRQTGRSQIVVTGAEAHVCVLQTALGLVGLGLHVVLVTDAIGSRRGEDRVAAISRLQKANVLCATTEMVIFEWLENANTPEFQTMLPTIRNLVPSRREED